MEGYVSGYKAWFENSIAYELNIWFEGIGALILGLALLLTIWEFTARFMRREKMKNYTLDSITSLITYVFFGLLSTFGLYFTLGSYFYNGIPIYRLETTWWSILAAYIVADIVYYWTHRWFHRINLFWATHSVHHSSPYINTPMAFRFGPADALIPTITHLPMAFFFDPVVVYIVMVLNEAYQALLHTDRIGKLGPLEWILNTPSHHRVHHGNNDKYIDTNYGGTFIIWDKMFCTFQKEEETPTYGLVKQINSVNPFWVFFHGFVRLGQKLLTARGFGEVWKCLFYPPDWQTRKEIEQQK